MDELRRSSRTVVRVEIAAAIAAGLGAFVVTATQTGALALPARLWFFLQVAPVLAVGLLLVRHRPESPVARWLLACGTGLALATACEAVLHSAPSSAVLVGLLQMLHLGGVMTAYAALAVLLAIFPTGRPDSAAAVCLVRAALVNAVAATILTVLSRDHWEFLETAVWRPMPERFPLHVDALTRLHAVGFALQQLPMVLLTGGLVLLFRRQRRVAAPLRPAVRVVWRTAMAAAVASVTLSALGAAHVLSAGVVASVPCMFLIPLGMGIAALRDDAFDLDLLVRRTVLYGGVTAVATGACAAAAAALGVAAGGVVPWSAAVVVAVLATLALTPLRRRFEARAGRWAFGEPVSGYTLLSRVGAALEHAYDLEELAPRLAAMVRDGLDVRWASIAVALDDGAPDLVEVLGRAGTADPGEVPARRVALSHAGVVVGEIACGERSTGVLTAQDDAVLADLARQVGLAVHNARLAAELAGRLAEIRRQAGDLNASRARLVSAQETERRRLERDLHDGAQQEIVALMAKLRMAQNRLARGQSDDLGDLLGELQGDARSLLDDLRELAHGIRPPVLSDRGLVGAIEARATRLPLDVSIEAPADVAAARYADDVEGAAWFAVSEACANALKHSGADRLVITLSETHGTLRVTVTDDGCGIPAQTATTGLRNLRDRLEAVGGDLSVSSGPEGGTVLRAILPARRRAGADV